MARMIPFQPRKHAHLARSRPGPAVIGAGHPGVPRWKRILDVSIVLIAAPIWAPLMLGIGAAIKLLSSGPMLFRQERIGLGGTRFVCLKFRTMHTGADTLAHEKYLADLIRSNRPMTKMDGQDPRLIPLAWILRSTGLDELPQLFNVLQGEMSLVGPRPSTPQEYNAWSRAQRARVRTLPGLTGLWQVNGKNRTTFREMIELDVRYVETMCLWLDLAIMLRTPATLLAQVADTVLNRTHLGPSLGGIARTLIQKPRAPGADAARAPGWNVASPPSLAASRSTVLEISPSPARSRLDTVASEPRYRHPP